MLIYIIIGIAIIAIFLIKNYRKPRRRDLSTALDELYNDPSFKQQQELFNLMQVMGKDGTDQDEMPEGIGEFGHEVTNPIPVNTTFGITSYLAKLRTLDGVKVGYERLGPKQAPNITSIIDAYEITANKKVVGILYLCAYNKKNSSKAPKGFKLAPDIFS